MSAATDVLSVCKDVLTGLELDEDTLEYISMGIMDDGSVLSLEELSDFVGPLIEEQCGGDEGKASALARALHERLAPKAEAAAVPKAKAAPAVQPKAMPLGGLLGSGGYNGGPAEELEAPAAKKAAAPKATAPSKSDVKAAKLQQKKAEAATAQSAELDAEVEAAREKAIRLRSTKGSFNGAIELGPLTLPNPGGGLDLLEQACFTIVQGHRYGLIGRNGKGKSTLLRYLAARRVGGMPDAVTVHYVSQEVAFTAAALDQTPVEAVLEADVERRLLLKDVKDLEGSTKAEDQQRVQDALAHLEAIEADTAHERATALLKNLGFSDELRSRQLRALSGGWRVRVALAAALFAKPDVLLLDEPTNHLSIQAVMWLSHELSTSPTWQSRIVVVVSHDRVFLDESCTDMLHISGVARKLTASKGSYSTWAKRRAEQQKARERQLEVEAAEREKLKEYVGHGFKYGGSSGQINMMQKMKKQLEKNEMKQEAEAEELAALNEDGDLPLSLLAGGEIDGYAVQLKNVSFAYPGLPPLFRGAEFTVDAKSRMVFVGENGNGKTTLVKLLLGELQATSGQLSRNRGARIALVNQHHADQLDLTMTPLQFMLNKFPGDGSYNQEQAIRSHLSQCGVPLEQMTTTARVLSGGQRSRVAMAAVSFEKPHILVMDEPTNNLDLGSIEALAASVQDFKGGVVLVSHDQYFVSQVAREVWIVANGAVRRAESFEAYRSGILSSIKKR
eukprot:TRINITY_DN80778_c0_g1_i1.p1 TRINITY_DN80778_c0_g1~~TRINITY_DN80778_c0_g1_i1.p1  ORF type:complete len:732 (-),score=222.01 TRINITY_DN80778_c0_g1_i1:129-2324(-)